MQPVVLTSNRPRSFYRGAGRIDQFRGIAGTGDPYFPEDWVASTTSRFNATPAGLTTLPDGRLLATAIAEDPIWWLGPRHVERHGADPTILVKLLDAGERLPLHVHPNRKFAADHLASPYGKTEAWVIIDAEPGAVVHLGFSRDIEAAELDRWVERQDVAEMLAHTNQVPVRAGDAILCPAGLPHAIGGGIFLVEVQEPTDFSVLLEWQGYAIDGPSAGHLGLGFDEALRCVDRSAWSTHRLADLARDLESSDVVGRGTSAKQMRPGVRPLFPESADDFFAAARVRPNPVSTLDAGFSVLIVLTGAGVIDSEHGDPLTVRAGDTILVPYACGRFTVRGDVEATWCGPGRI